ncbi:hypothetical protein MLD38_008405 [Melastoma candidum]|uniref:Uncharacterized protein n=1 Tax=Melastoma candidum TaxID=119954 RepID=A0ACB9RTD0_9MYRT|nr:hypothetical protein MLD38_008405 [Melastoma candidum]
MRIMVGEIKRRVVTWGVREPFNPTHPRHLPSYPIITIATTTTTTTTTRFRRRQKGVFIRVIWGFFLSTRIWWYRN